VQGASGVDLSQLTPAEREALAALLTKAKIQQPEPPEAGEPAETKPRMAGKSAFSSGRDAGVGTWRSSGGKDKRG
jgi:hypothetical protein